jgi:hypothetical protein
MPIIEFGIALSQRCKNTGRKHATSYSLGHALSQCCKNAVRKRVTYTFEQCLKDSTAQTS